MHARTTPDTVVGSALGIVTFGVVALHVALTYGEFAGTLLANGINAQGFPRQALLNIMSLIGVIAIGSLFSVVGAIIGTAVGEWRKKPENKRPEVH